MEIKGNNYLEIVTHEMNCMHLKVEKLIIILR